MNAKTNKYDKQAGTETIRFSPLCLCPKKPGKQKNSLIIVVMFLFCWAYIGHALSLRDADFNSLVIAQSNSSPASSASLPLGQTYDNGFTGMGMNSSAAYPLPTEQLHEPNARPDSSVQTLGTLESSVKLETANSSTPQDLENEIKRNRDAIIRQDRLNSRMRFHLQILSSLTIIGVFLWLVNVLILRRNMMKNTQIRFEETILDYLAEYHERIHENDRSGDSQETTAKNDYDQKQEIPPSPPEVQSAKTVKSPDAPQRPDTPAILPPSDLVKYLIEQCQGFNCFRYQPVLPREEWDLGLATETGNVRTENQDYGLGFHIAEHDILIIADGCGGVAQGQRAAYLAALYAALSIIRIYGTAPPWQGPNACYAAAKAVQAAEARLAKEANKFNISLEDRAHLRTTLIIIIGGNNEFGYAYIGDGGACVIRSTGQIEPFLHPQKADEYKQNILAASLGPRMDGEPVVGKIYRSPGDLIIAGTDGVFDRVSESFPKDVLRVAIQQQGDLQQVTEQLIQELAEYKDANGYVCDDNLTLGLMGDGTSPVMPMGFWNSDDNNLEKTDFEKSTQ